MFKNDRVNISSLALVSDELVSTIEQAATKLEQFVLEPDNQESLQVCIDAIEQIRGTLQLIQLNGAALLAQEIATAAKLIDPKVSDSHEELLEVLTGAFFILPRYLEYIQQTRKVMPALLIPYINDLRAANNIPLLPDSYFLDIPMECHYPARAEHPELGSAEQSKLLKRLRHMYQVGLLNALRGKQVPAALGIMERALERLETLSNSREKAKLWWVGSAALMALRSHRMELTKPRKMLLMALDREIKKVLCEPSTEFDQKPPHETLKELLFICALSTDPTHKISQVLSTYQVDPSGFTDQELMREREALRGPSIHTVSSVAAVIQDELRSIKDILENASLAADKGLGGYADLAVHLEKVADILAVVGLVSAATALKQEITRIEGWHNSRTSATAEELGEIADALLYVESTVSGMEWLNLSGEKLTQANALARREIVASSQLAKAESLVLQEAEAGLALVKRALSAFVESNYDMAHIKNVTSTLTTVRGGMAILNLARAATIVARCIQFIEETLLHGEYPAALTQRLETFADTVIALDYYLDAVKSDKTTDDSVLAVAEESLQALGYQISS